MLSLFLKQYALLSSLFLYIKTLKGYDFKINKLTNKQNHTIYNHIL